MSHQNALVNYLTQLGVSFADANDAAQLTTLSSEALDLLGRKPDGTLAPTAAHDWEEWLSDEHTRYYYVNKPAGLNQWDAPLAFRFLEWALDAHLYGISIRLARDIYQRIDGVVSMNPQDVAWRALGTLSKMLTNVAGCNNSVEKYRTVRVQNPAFKAAVYNVPGALAVLQIAGFKLLGETVAIPADAPMAPLRATAARVQRYSSGKGHSGTARVDDSGRTGKTRPPSPYYGTAGFMYQEQIWHCGACDHAVNDGSERLWTGRVDAPEGEFR